MPRQSTLRLIAIGFLICLFGGRSWSQTVSDAKGFFSSGSSTPNLGSVTAGVSGLTMLVTGTGFVDARGKTPGPRLIWVPSTGTCPGSTCELDAFWLDSTQLQVEIPGDLVGRADTGAKLAVANYPYSTRSNSIPFPVNDILSPAQLPAGNIGSQYAEKLFNGGTVPVAFSLASGSYPPGLQPNESGKLAGVPSSSGSYNFTVIVRDAWATLRQAAFSVTIGGTATGITFTPVTPAPGVVGVAYSQAFTGSGGTAPYTFSVTSGTLPSGLTLSTSGTISGTPTILGTSQFTVQVIDSKNATGSVTLAITIGSGGAGLTFSPTSLPSGLVGQVYSQSLAGSGGTLPYTFSILSGSLPAGLSLAANGTLSGTPTTAGASTFIVRMTDGVLATVAGALSITITAPVSAISFTPSTLPDGTATSNYSVSLSGKGGTPPYTFSIVQGALPRGLTLSPSGLLSGLSQQTGSWPLRIDVKDATGAEGFGETNLTILAGVEVSTGTLEGAVELQSYKVTLTAAGGVAPYVWLLTSGRLPSGLVLDGATGIISGTPESEGVSGFTVTARDSLGGTASRALQISVAARPPQISSQGLPAAVANSPYSFTLAGFGGTGKLEWSLDSGSLPPGLTLSPLGVVSGLPTTAGSYPFSIRVTDSESRSASASLSLLVKPAPLVISTETLPETPGGLVRLVFRATGGTTPYTWTLTNGALPSGLSLAPGGVLGGKTFAVGRFDFTLLVKDSDGVTATRGYSLVLTPAPLELLTDSLPGGVVSVTYFTKLSGEGGLPPYNWSVKGLPSGLSVDSVSGDITGAPTVHGTSRVTIEMSDSAGVSTSLAIDLVVVPAPLVFETRTLPLASLGIAYATAISVTGGVKPYHWLVIGPGLPPGLVLFQDGFVRGSATSSGTAVFTITVTDSRDIAVSREFSLQVVGGRVTVTSRSVPDGRIGRVYSHTVAADGGAPPYRWSAELPEGLNIDPAVGSIAGVPSRLGLSEIRVIATDTAGDSSFATYPIRFALPDLPAVAITGPPDTSDPLAQSEVRVTLAEPFPVPLTGTLTLNFRSESGMDDSTVQFSTGGRTAAFTIPTDTTEAVFALPNLGLQMGTIVGEAQLSASFSAAENELVSVPAPVRTIRITPARPTVASIRATRSERGLDVEVSGNSSVRNVSKAQFRFAFADPAVAPVEATILLDDLSREWFGSDQSRLTGGQFTFFRSFGLPGVASVTVILTDRLGASEAMSAVAR